MSFNDNIHLDPSRVRTSGAGRKIAGAGGGSILGVLLILGFSYLTGIDLTSLISSQAPSSSSSSSSVDVSTCKTGADANERVECRMVATAQSLDEVWKTQLADQHAGVPMNFPISRSSRTVCQLHVVLRRARWVPSTARVTRRCTWISVSLTRW